MRDAVRAWVLRVLRVPPEPRVPEGEGSHVRVFRASANFYRYNLARWALAQCGALIGLVVWLIIVRAAPRELGGVLWVLTTFEVLAWIAFLVQLPFTYAMLRLDFEMRWYIVTGRSLRIREGLASIREQTMTFANIQNMAIRQGPLQRLLGIADLEVHTAGGGGGGGSEGAAKQATSKPMHVGIFRGVDNAEEIRDTIRERVRFFRDAGLGDPDDAPAVEHEEAAHLRPVPLLAAAQELLGEARQLRRALGAR
jgi:membrane protein YdbS with pleckstrin-like domain